MNSEEYFLDLKKNVDEIYEVAERARSLGLDPVDKVEIPLASSMAEKVVALISTIYPQLLGSQIVERILELEKEYGKLSPVVVFKIAEEIARQNFCKFKSELEAIDAGIRVGFAYTTLGVVSSPIEGFTELKLGKTKEGKEYFIAYFSGPIRSAGTTASCLVLMLIDYLREVFGYAKYDPTEDEIKRYVTECTDYHERITNLQYFPSSEEIEFLAKNLPIQIAGEPTEKMEVSNYKNLERVDTNRVRGGMCLIFAEGLAQKAMKGFRLYTQVKNKGINATGFDYLEGFIDLQKKKNSKKSSDKDLTPTYIKDLVAGRPIFGHPSCSGGFRFRYGRSRVDGFSAVSLHSATMGITDDFIAVGTQLKIEKPTKGCVVACCDSIEGPVVKLKDGSVKQIKTKEEARRLYKDVEEIIYLGDILFPFSDLLNRNQDMIKPGYVEEWWYLELKEKGFDKELDLLKINLKKAVELSEKYKISLFPKFIFYWTEISSKQFEDLIDWLKKSKFDKGIILSYDEKNNLEAKRALELLGVPHSIKEKEVIIDKKNSEALLVNLGCDINSLENYISILKNINKDFKKSVLENVNSSSKFEIRDKAGSFIGARMGRPEKAKLRKLSGSPNVLFPVGNSGGRLKTIQAACESGSIKQFFPLYYCENCKKESIYTKCESCNKNTKKKFYFYDSKEKLFTNKSSNSQREGLPYCKKDLDINYYLDKALDKLGFLREDLPPLIKCVKDVSSSEKRIENLAKGILRAKYDLQVNKDGTIRFDCTELPLVSFKPKEVFVSVEKLKILGYTKDIYGKDLKDDNQILELKPHDILLPSSPESPDEKADEVFINISKFVDDELQRFYGIRKFYDVKNREDLVGHLTVCMAPHNCAGVVSRIIGFSNTLGIMASPYMHAAIRRDCDGDEAAIMLLGDVLLNFSRKFLPSHRGGTQDAPLVLNARIEAGEVDDQILDFELLYEYPLDLYKKAESGIHSSEVKVNTVKDVLKKGENPFENIGFTHDTTNFNNGVHCSSYKTLPTMQDKVEHQMALVEKIRAVDEHDTARLVIERHFLRDMKGNLRKFSIQNFRCTSCNEIVRRPPLDGVCPRCGGKMIFTINEGGIKKYLKPAIELSEKYNISTYLKQDLELLKSYIDSIFGEEKQK